MQQAKPDVGAWVSGNRNPVCQHPSKCGPVSADRVTPDRVGGIGAKTSLPRSVRKNQSAKIRAPNHQCASIRYEVSLRGAIGRNLHLYNDNNKFALPLLRRRAKPCLGEARQWCALSPIMPAL